MSATPNSKLVNTETNTSLVASLTWIGGEDRNSNSSIRYRYRGYKAFDSRIILQSYESIVGYEKKSSQLVIITGHTSQKWKHYQFTWSRLIALCMSILYILIVRVHTISVLDEDFCFWLLWIQGDSFNGCPPCKHFCNIAILQNLLQYCYH